jgi:uncharacterized membrane protein YeiH
LTLAAAIGLADLVAVGVFAVSGALAAAERRLDILAFIFFGTLTGVGGGTLRDVLLQLPVFWISDTRYLWMCILLASLTWYLVPLLRARQRLLLWADAAGLSLFSVLGAAKALQAGAPEVVAVVMGVMSASFGGLIRDNFLGRDSVLMGQELYVSAALGGGAGYALLVQLPDVPPGAAIMLSMVLAFVLRAGALLWGWHLPFYRR